MDLSVDIELADRPLKTGRALQWTSLGKSGAAQLAPDKATAETIRIGSDYSPSLIIPTINRHPCKNAKRLALMLGAARIVLTSLPSLSVP